MIHASRAILVLAALLLSLLAAGLARAQTAAAPAALSGPAPGTVSELQAFFDRSFETFAARSPEFLTRLGRDERKTEWNDRSEAAGAEESQLVSTFLTELRERFDAEGLPPQDRVSYRLYESGAEERLADYGWRLNSYPLNHMWGVQSGLPSFLISQHTITDEADAAAYLTRLEAVPGPISQVIDAVRLRAAHGTIPPDWSLDKVADATERLLQGVETDQHPLFADFRRKVAGLNLPPGQVSALEARARAALTERFAPAYRQLLTFVRDELRPQATPDCGVWKLPDGDAYYRYRLQAQLTLPLTPEQVHADGLAQVARIHAEMRAIMAQVGFEGDLPAFFEHTRTDPQFFYPEEGGRAQYIADATAMIDAVRPRMAELFALRPRADVEVRAVEPFREQGAALAFYEPPSLDGTRPGFFYSNLSNLREQPRWMLPALVYHEAIPGHHMQIAIQQELGDLPMFRRFERSTSYTEGWGLYSEQLADELGLYTDPYARFGYLSMQLRRAARMVVDTGLHWKRWTREQGIAYLAENTPFDMGNSVRETERYCVTPGQAPTYMVGQLFILRLREEAKARLAARFDLRAFHSVVLGSGSVTLPILEELVSDWVARRETGAVE